MHMKHSQQPSIDILKKMLEENNILIKDADNLWAKAFLSEKNDTINEVIERIEKTQELEKFIKN